MSGVCPACQGFLTSTAKPHCQRFTCEWVSCRCGATVEIRSGKFYEIKVRGDGDGMAV